MEKYKLKIHIGVNDLFDSSMNSIKNSKNHIINIIFTFASLIILIYLFINYKINEIDSYKVILIVLCVILFPIIQPIIIYIKILINYNKYPLKDVELKVCDDILYISNYENSNQIKISELNSIKKYSNMIVIMYDYIHGQIIPNRSFNEVDKDEFYNYFKNKIDINNN